MLHLLQLEWKKAKNYPVFKVLIGLYLLLLPTLILIGKSFKGNKISDDFPNILDIYFFPNIWKFLGYSGNWLVFFFLGFLGVLMITNEFNNKTMRQNIITGMSRSQFFAGKVSFILAVSLFAALYYFVIALIFGFTHTETVYASRVTVGFGWTFRYFLMCVGYMSFAMFLAILIRRTGIAIFLYLIYIMFLELILRWVVHMKFLKTKSMHFYPMNAVEDLMPIPFMEEAEKFFRKNNFDFYLTTNEAIITTLIYTSIFLGLSYWLLKRRDL